MKMKLTKIKDLQFSTAQGLDSVHAASGLVKVRNHFYIISDDDLSLLQVSLEKDQFQKIRLRQGSLPKEAKERKKVKPDWESLIHLPPHLGHEGLLIVPSGSQPNRQGGCFVSLNPVSQMLSVHQVDFSKIYQKLVKDVADLNIEGTALFNSIFKLFQRGNGASGQNAIIDLDLTGVIEDLKNSQPLQAHRILKIENFNLGHLNGVPLGFTDGFAIDDFLFFLAAAENTASTYEDGEFVGSILGCINSKGELVSTWELDCPFKPEGLCMEKTAGGYKIYVVTDADDPGQVSCLYEGDFFNQSS